MLRYLNGYILYPALEKLSKRDITSKVQELNDFEKKTKKQQKLIQRQKLYEALVFAGEEIEYYKRVFEELAFDPKAVLDDIEEIKNLPILTKDKILEEGQSLRTNKAWHGRKTGGSTGKSVWFYYDNNGLDWSAAINQYCYNLCGKKAHHKDCHSSADLGLAPILWKHKAQQFLKLSAMNRSVLMINNYSDDNLDKYYKYLKRQNPYLLQAHPSTVYSISLYVERTGIKPRQIFKIFEPTGEMLTKKMVDHIETFLKCKVVNRYGNAEFGVVAHSFSPHNYDQLGVFDRAFYVEDCSEAPLIISNFTNLGMPLFRYDTGDIGTVSSQERGTVLSDIKGRIHDSVIIESNRIPTHFIMDFLDHKVGGVNEFQIIVNVDNSIEFRIDTLDSEFERIERAILLEWPSGVVVKQATFDDFVRVGHRSKFKHLVDLRGRNES